jgi:predicted TIM-barrel fold metal-dependent hydrolase
LRRDFLLDEYAALAQSAGVVASVVVQTVTVPEEIPDLLAWPWTARSSRRRRRDHGLEVVAKWAVLAR